MKEKKEIELSKLLHVAICAASIPHYRAMGFKVDSKINSMAKEAEAFIRYQIGDDLKALKEELNEGIEKIRKPFVDQFIIDGSGLTGQELTDLEQKTNSNIGTAIKTDQELAELRKQLVIAENKLWERVVKNEIDPIVIEDREYADKFSAAAEKVAILEREFTIDGYQALLDLISYGFITTEK